MPISKSLIAPPPAAPPTDPFDGVLLVDKPAGPTSHDLVARVRSNFRFNKVGHGGTLDPNATGLLVLLIGRGTRLSNRIMGGDKTYTGTLRLGVVTDSQDIDGKVLEQHDPSSVTREALLEAMARATGDIYQTPPMVSAVKIAGVPLYKLARKGKTVERQPRLVHIYRFSLSDWRPPEADFEVRCTKGVYVRTLCHDVGARLGCGAFLQSLRRTMSGNLSIDDALPFDRLLDMDREILGRHIIPYYRFLETG